MSYLYYNCPLYFSLYGVDWYVTDPPSIICILDDAIAVTDATINVDWDSIDLTTTIITRNADTKGWDEDDEIGIYVEENGDVRIVNMTLNRSTYAGNIKKNVIFNYQELSVNIVEYIKFSFEIALLGDFALSNKRKYGKTIEHNGFLYMLDNVSFNESNEYWLSLVRYEKQYDICSVFKIGKDFLSQFDEFDNDEYYQNNYFDILVYGDDIYIVVESPSPSTGDYREGVFFVFNIVGTGINLINTYHSKNFLYEQPILAYNNFYFKNGETFDFPNNAYFDTGSSIYDNGITYYGHNNFLLTLYNNKAFIRSMYVANWLNINIANDYGFGDVLDPLDPMAGYVSISVGINDDYLFFVGTPLWIPEISYLPLDIYKLASNGDTSLMQSIQLRTYSPTSGDFIRVFNNHFFAVLHTYKNYQIHTYDAIYGIYRFNSSHNQYEHIQPPNVGGLYVESFSKFVIDIYELPSNRFLLATLIYDEYTVYVNVYRYTVYEYNGNTQHQLVFSKSINWPQSYSMAFYNDDTLFLYAISEDMEYNLHSYLSVIRISSDVILQYEITNNNIPAGKFLGIDVYKNYVFVPGDCTTSNFLYIYRYNNNGSSLTLVDAITPPNCFMPFSYDPYSFASYQIKGDKLICVYHSPDSDTFYNFAIYQLDDDYEKFKLINVIPLPPIVINGEVLPSSFYEDIFIDFDFDINNNTIYYTLSIGRNNPRVLIVEKIIVNDNNILYVTDPLDSFNYTDNIVSLIMGNYHYYYVDNRYLYRYNPNTQILEFLRDIPTYFPNSIYPILYQNSKEQVYAYSNLNNEYSYLLYGVNDFYLVNQDIMLDIPDAKRYFDQDNRIIVNNEYSAIIDTQSRLLDGYYLQDLLVEIPSATIFKEQELETIIGSISFLQIDHDSFLSLEYTYSVMQECFVECVVHPVLFWRLSNINQYKFFNTNNKSYTKELNNNLYTLNNISLNDDNNSFLSLLKFDLSNNNFYICCLGRDFFDYTNLLLNTDIYVNFAFDVTIYDSIEYFIVEAPYNPSLFFVFVINNDKLSYFKTIQTSNQSSGVFYTQDSKIYFNDGYYIDFITNVEGNYVKDYNNIIYNNQVYFIDDNNSQINVYKNNTTIENIGNCSYNNGYEFLEFNNDIFIYIDKQYLYKLYTANAIFIQILDLPTTYDNSLSPLLYAQQSGYIYSFLNYNTLNNYLLTHSNGGNGIFVLQDMSLNIPESNHYFIQDIMGIINIEYSIIQDMLLKIKYYYLHDLVIEILTATIFKEQDLQTNIDVTQDFPQDMLVNITMHTLTFHDVGCIVLLYYQQFQDTMQSFNVSTTYILSNTFMYENTYIVLNNLIVSLIYILSNNFTDKHETSYVLLHKLLLNDPINLLFYLKNSLIISRAYVLNNNILDYYDKAINLLNEINIAYQKDYKINNNILDKLDRVFYILNEIKDKYELPVVLKNKLNDKLVNYLLINNNLEKYLNKEITIENIFEEDISGEIGISNYNIYISE